MTTLNINSSHWREAFLRRRPTDLRYQLAAIELTRRIQRVCEHDYLPAINTIYDNTITCRYCSYETEATHPLL